jgi:hypothetical protein
MNLIGCSEHGASGGISLNRGIVHSYLLIIDHKLVWKSTSNDSSESSSEEAGENCLKFGLNQRSDCENFLEMFKGRNSDRCI